jgi:hypothetical protein
MPGSVTARPVAGATPGTQTSGLELYRIADLSIFPAGDGLSLVYVRDNGAAAFYRADILRVLAGCGEFRTIEEHVEQCLAGTGTVTQAAALRRELFRLRAEGFLVSADGRPSAADSRAPLAPISTIVVPTCNRVPLLRRMITGYAENCVRYGWRVRFAVADDSPDRATQADCEAMLRRLERRLGVGISYVGLGRKSAFALRLASTGGIPQDVVRFGCLPSRGCGVTVGANRNMLLLLTAGERIFSADDDTVCVTALPPGHGDGVELDSGGNPLQLWFFPDRDEALAAVRYVQEDVLGWHGRYLGAAPAPVLAGAGPASAARSDPALLGHVRDAVGHIRVTANGVVGDCGWDNPDFCLFQDGTTFARLAGSPGGFRVNRTTREMIQAVPRTTITGRADPKFAMCIGLDNTDLLPPFPPAGRAEEVAFGAILTACFSPVYAAHLPLVLRHDPAAGKRFSAAGMFSIGLGSWLPSCISRFDPGLAASPTVRLSRLGNFLTDLGRLPEGAFDEFARLTVWDSMSGMIGSLEARLDDPEPPPDYWAWEARQFMVRARRSALAPADEWYAAIGGRAILQRRLEQLGQLLIWWPAMIQAARDLRAAGDELALALRDLATSHPTGQGKRNAPRSSRHQARWTNFEPTRIPKNQGRPGSVSTERENFNGQQTVRLQGSAAGRDCGRNPA